MFNGIGRYILQTVYKRRLDVVNREIAKNQRYLSEARILLSGDTDMVGEVLHPPAITIARTQISLLKGKKSELEGRLQELGLNLKTTETQR